MKTLTGTAPATQSRKCCYQSTTTSGLFALSLRQMFLNLKLLNIEETNQLIESNFSLSCRDEPYRRFRRRFSSIRSLEVYPLQHLFLLEPHSVFACPLLLAIPVTVYTCYSKLTRPFRLYVLISSPSGTNRIKPKCL